MKWRGRGEDGSGRSRLGGMEMVLRRVRDGKEGGREGSGVGEKCEGPLVFVFMFLMGEVCVGGRRRGVGRWR